jgi:hypothetical protein
MIEQILPNNNKTCYSNFSLNFEQVNTPRVLFGPAHLPLCRRSPSRCRRGIPSALVQPAGTKSHDPALVQPAGESVILL